MKSGLCIPNMVYLVQFVCLSDGVNLKVVAISIAEIERLVHHDVRNSMPHPNTRHRSNQRKLAFTPERWHIVDYVLMSSFPRLKVTR